MIRVRHSELPGHFPDLSPGWLEKLQELDSATPPGEIVLDSVHQVRVNVFDHPGRSEADAVTESHRRFIDLHLPLDTAERIRLLPGESLVVTTSYDPEIDAEFYRTPVNALPGEEETVLLPGEILLIPAEIPHATQMMDVGDDGRQSRRKAVVKIPVQYWRGPAR